MRLRRFIAVVSPVCVLLLLWHFARLGVLPGSSVAELLWAQGGSNLAVVVRHAPTIGGGRVEGSLQVLTGENVALAGGAVITSDLLVPGTPTVQITGNPTFGGVVEGAGSQQPTGYVVALSGSAVLGHLVTRTDPSTLDPIAPPPATSGTRDVVLSQAGQTAGDFTTLRDLTLTGKADPVTVPPGTYRRFAADSRTVFILGIPNSSQATVYNFQEIVLSASSELRLQGPVEITLATRLSLASGSTMGTKDQPQRLTLRVAGATVEMEGSSLLYGVVRAPSALVTVKGKSLLQGLVFCHRMLIEGGGVVQRPLQAGANQPPVVNSGNDQTHTFPVSISLVGTATDDQLPLGSSLSYSWSQVSGPGTMTFANPTQPSTTATASAAGIYLLRLAVNDTELTGIDDVQITLNAPNQPPQVSAGPDQTITLQAGNPNAGVANLSGTVTDDGLPLGGTLSSTWSLVSGPGSVVFGNASQATSTATFTMAGSYVLRLTASDSLLSASDDIAITVNPPAQNLPPDPVTVAPPLNRTVVTTTFKATEFLYAGANPIQTGVAPGTIVPLRAAVLQGKVTRQDGLPLPGVKIAILNHPELGTTLSRANGAFDIAVNGGGTLVVSYEKDGFIPIQRQAQVPWQQHVVLPIVVMIPYDSQVTSIDLSQNVPMQVAQSSLLTDTDGTRRTTLLFPGANTATMVLPNGSTQPLSQLHVRATEYTVGAQGLRAMPAELPPNSAYTYCVELSVDEAIAAGATKLTFSKPVIQYVQNFLGIFIGTPVPEGYYDRIKGRWVASDNGLVVQIVSLVDGQAQLDVDGSGMPATPQALDALGITGAERQQLALLYQPGQSLWRMTIPHFSPWDSNFGIFPPADAQPPMVGDPAGDNKKVKCIPCPGSVIQVQNQTLGQAVDIVGTPLSLHYVSDRVPGRTAANTLEIPISGATVPNGLRQIILQTVIGGTSTWSKYGDVYDPFSTPGAVITQDFFPPTPNQSASIVWEGIGSYQRKLQGEQPMNVRIGYVYDSTYQAVPRFGYVGNGIRINTPDSLPGDRSRRQVALWKDWVGGINLSERAIGAWDAGALGLGGWSLNVHHVYDPVRRTLYFGDGRERSANIDRIMKTVAGTGPSSGAGAFSGDGGPATLARLRYPNGIAVAPDGSLYVSDSNNVRIRRVGLDGVITTVAGGNSAACSVATAACGDGGPATLARLGFPEEIKFGPDGSLYIADASFRRIRRVATDGIITTVAGTGNSGFSGDGGPATLANLSFVHGLAVAPDGALYFSDTGNHRVRRVGTDGIISTIAGTGIASYTGDGGAAANAPLNFPEGLALGPDGTLYIADSSNHRVRKIGLGGTITTVAGNGNSGLVVVNGATVLACSVGQCGDGGPATQARIGFPWGVAVGPDGSLYITGSHLLRRVSPNGIISSVAGSNNFGSSGGEVGPATQLNLFDPRGVAVGPDGTPYIADTANHRIRTVEQLLPGFAQTAQFEILIPDESGREVYVFDASGQHLRTVDTLTQGIVYQFTYNGSGMLTAVTDGSGNVTTIERSGNAPTAIISPYGQRTTLSLDPNGYLASITNPASESIGFTYSSTGLMNTLTDPKGGLHQFQYSAAGRLIHDADPAGGFTVLARNGINPTDFDVTRSTALGHASNFKVETLPTGEERRTNTSPEGTQVIETKSPNGGNLTTLPDGTVDNLLEAADPRWGMMAALPKSQTVTSPGGLASTITNTRAVSLSAPGNPFSLQTQTDTINVNGRIYTSVFDGATRRFTNTTPVGRQSSGTIDTLGRIIQAQLASLEPVSFGYDARGRLQTVSQGSGSETRSSTHTYNSNGYLETITDPLLRVTNFEYDDTGRVTRQTLPGNRIINFTYDANSNLTSLIPPGRPQHGFNYTPVDLMNEYDPPSATNVGTRFTTYSYDTERKSTLITRPDGQTIDFDYDTAGRLSALNLPSRQLTYGYNATTGNFTSITDSAGSSLAFTYDGSLPKTATWSGPVNGSVGWNYDNNFRVASRTINGGNTISFGYDNDSLLTSVGSLTLTRNTQNGLLAGTTLGNVTDSWSYDSFAEPTSYSASVSGTQVYATTFTHDKLGRITSKTETIQSLTDTYTYGYDSAGRLETVTKNGVLASQYTYDANGNRLIHATGAGTATYTTDNQDRLSSWNLAPDTWNLTYTANGELQSKTNGSQTTTYSYDILGNLRQVALPDGTQIEYLIDAQNRRVGKKVNGVLVQGWLYGNRLNPVAELDGSGNIVSTFMYASRSNVPDYMVKGGVTYRLISDHLGSPRLIINTSDGTIAQRLDYDEFGQITQDTNPSFQPFGFAGGLHERQTKLTRFGVRDYEAEAGRWTAKDPIVFAGGDGNLYGYVLGDPVNLSDSAGLLVEVYYELIAGSNSGLAAAMLGASVHSYLRVKTPQFDLTVELEGPLPGKPHGNPTIRPFDPKRPYIGKSPVNRPLGSNGCDDYRFERAIIGEFGVYFLNPGLLPQYRNDIFQYPPRFNNSNTFANHLITSQGGAISDPHPFAYGLTAPFK